MTLWSRDKIMEFIKIYRRNECLWKIKSREYSNKPLKDQAYADLLEFSKSVDPQYTHREDVIKKVNNLRSSFRKELKKVQAAKMSGRKHVPRLWYFDELMFLSKQVIEESADSSFSQSHQAISEPWNEFSEDSFTNSDDEEKESNGKVSPPSPSPVISHQCSTPLYQPKQEFMKFRKRKNLTTQSSTTLKNMKVDRFDIFGKHVACCIRDIPELQQIFVEKLIADVLFEGRLGNLSRASHVDNGLNNPSDLQQGNTLIYTQHSGTTPSSASNERTLVESQLPQPCELYRNVKVNKIQL